MPTTSVAGTLITVGSLDVRLTLVGVDVPAPNLNVAPIYLARDRGLFVADRLDVSISVVRNSPAAVQQLVGGHASIVRMSSLVLVRTALTRTGRSRGKDVEQFLRKAGVKEIGERDYLAAIIRVSYAGDAQPMTTESQSQEKGTEGRCCSFAALTSAT